MGIESAVEAVGGAGADNVDFWRELSVKYPPADRPPGLAAAVEARLVGWGDSDVPGRAAAYGFLAETGDLDPSSAMADESLRRDAPAAWLHLALPCIRGSSALRAALMESLPRAGYEATLANLRLVAAACPGTPDWPEALASAFPEPERDRVKAAFAAAFGSAWGLV